MSTRRSGESQEILSSRRAESIQTSRGRTKRVMRALALLGVLLAFISPAARADFPGDVPDRFKFQAGYVDAQFTTQASLSLTDGPVGAYVNFEDIFNLPEYKRAWNAEGFYRFSERGYVDFGYVDFERKSSHVIEQDLDWGDVTFLANGKVSSKFGTAFGYVAYRHDFLREDRVHISGSAGFSYLTLDSGLEANGTVEDQNGNPISGDVSKNANISFPVPLLGLQVDWGLTKRQAIQMYWRTLYIDYQQFRGGITQSAIRYEWYATQHFGIGGGINTYRINIQKYETGDFTARFQYSVAGLEVFLKMAF